MPYYIQLGLIFNLGVLLQAFFMIRYKLNSKNKLFEFSACLVLALISSFYLNNKIKLPDSLYFSILFFSFVFSILFGHYFKKDILPDITEHTILYFTIIFWYIFFPGLKSLLFSLDLMPSLDSLLLFPILIGSLGVLFISFSNVKLNIFWKLFFYIWFLSIIICLNILCFLSKNISFFFNKEAIITLSPLEILFSGMVFFYLIVNVLYIYELIPIPAKHQSFNERIKEWKKYINMLTNKYSDNQLKPVHSLLTILFLGGFFVSNYFLQFAPAYLIINIAIISYPLTRYFLARHNKK